MKFFFLEWQWSNIFYLSDGKGGLFDFNATLFVMILQLTLLTIFLKLLFFNRIGKVLEEREWLINDNLTKASKQLIKADEFWNLYNTILNFAYYILLVKIEDKEKEIKKDTAKFLKRQHSGFNYLNTLVKNIIPINEFINELEFQYIIFSNVKLNFSDYLIPSIIQKFTWSTRINSNILFGKK